MNNRELTHHGILGMKWGKRNGPPYPLDPEDHSASEKKAGWRKSLGKKTNKLIKKAINKEYKRERKDGGSYVLPAYRKSTGEEFNKAVRDFSDQIYKDPTYEKLAREAFNAERHRLLEEKKHYNTGLERYWDTKQAFELNDISERATQKLDEYIDNRAKKYLESMVDAMARDLSKYGLSSEPENMEAIRSHVQKHARDTIRTLSFGVDQPYLTYNPDNFYDPNYGVDVDKEKFRLRD